MNIPKGFIIESEPESMESPSIPEGFVIDNEPVAPTPATTPLPTTSITYADKSTYDGIVADIPRKNAINAQADQDAEAMVTTNSQEMTQADEAAMPALQEFAWLDNPFTSRNPEVQAFIKQMVQVWKDPKMSAANKLDLLKRLKSYTQKVQAGAQGILESEAQAVKTPMEEFATQPSIEADVFRSLGSAGLTVRNIFSSAARGVGVRDEIVNALWESERANAEKMGEVMAEIRNQGGLPSVVAQEVGQQAMATAIRLSAVGGSGIARGKDMLGSALRLGLFTAATTPGDMKERVAAGVKAATLMATPIVSGMVNNKLLAPLVDAAMNIGLGNLYGTYDWKRPEVWVPALITDVVFAALTKPGMGEDERARIMGVANKARDYYAQTVGADKALQQFREAAERVGMTAEDANRFFEPIKQAGVMDAEYKEPPARVELPKEEVAAEPVKQPAPTDKESLTVAEQKAGDVKPPELMTPDEHHGKQPVFPTPESEIPRYDDSGTAIRRWRGKEYDHASAVNDAVILDKPVSAAAVDEYKIKLPAGYVKEGDRYVFKGDAAAPKDAETPLTAKEQAEIEAEAQADLTPELPAAKAQEPTRVTVPEAKREVPIIPVPREPSAATTASPEAVTKLSQHAVKFADYVEKKGDKGLADQIRENPANMYKVVSDKQVTDYIGSLKDDEVRALAMDTPKEDIENRPLALVAAIEYENRQFNKRLQFMEQRDLAKKNGDTVKADATQKEIDALDGGIEQAVTAAKNISSSAGWILRSAQIGAQATPRTQLAKFISMLDKQGLEIKKPTQEKIVMQLNTASTALKNLEAYEEKFRKGDIPMAEGMAQLKKLRNDLFDAANKTRNTMHAASGGKFSDLYMSDVQGSLLTFISLIRNPTYNIAYKASVYGPQQIGATLVDALRSKITGGQRQLTFRNPLQAAKQNVAGFKQGIKDATRTMLHGYESVDNVKPMGEKSAKVSPFLAMKELFNYYRDPKNSDLPVVTDKTTGKSRVPTKVIAYKIAEAASSLPQGLLRMLPFGDRPFATMEKNRIMTNIGKTELNLKGEALDRFVAAPPRWADAAAEMEAAKATFQQDSKFTEAWLKFTGHADKIPLVGPAVKVGVRAGLSPFMKTLVNYTKTTMELTNPIVPAIRSVWNASEAARLSKENHVKKAGKIKKNIVESERALALSGVGVALGALGNYIAESGAWTSNDPKSSDKERARSYAQMGKGYINWSGLFRRLRGGDGAFRDGDLIMHTAWLGPVGTSISVRQNMKIAKTDNEPTPLESEVGMPAMEGNNLAASVGAAMELPIAQNMTSLLDQLRQRRFDFLEDMTSTLSSPAHMNAFKHFNKIFYKDIRQRKGVGQDLELVKDRLAREFVLATYPFQEWARAEGEMDKLLPRIHSPYTGEPVPATPRGKSLALWAVDPTDMQFKNLHPVETFLLEFQKEAEKADPSFDIYPTVPSVRSVFTDKSGKKYRVAGNKDTLQKLNKIHGEEIAKQVALFQESVDKDATIQEKVKYWKKYVKRAKAEYKKRVLIQFPSMKSIEDEGEDDNEE